MQDNTVSPKTQPRIGAENLFARWLRSPAGALLARAWFDRLAYYLLTRWFFPLSRLWAAAREAEGSPERFFEAVPIAPEPHLNRRLTVALQHFEAARAAARKSVV